MTNPIVGMALKYGKTHHSRFGAQSLGFFSGFARAMCATAFISFSKEKKVD
jgi:hypothetical protein